MREDPLVLAMAEAGSLDPNYLMMCNLVEGRCRSADIPQDSELKQVEGIMEELKVVQMSTGARILVRGEEVYVPAGERDHMMDVLHLGHPSAGSMVNGIRKKLQEKYDNCSACTLYRVSRIQNYRLYKVTTLEVWNVPKSVTGNVPNYRLGNARS